MLPDYFFLCFLIKCHSHFFQVRFNGSNFTVWDVGGQDKLRPLWRSYTRCTDGIIFVVDSCKEERLEEAKLELHKVCKGLQTNKNNLIPVLVLANKQDLPKAIDGVRLEKLLGLKDLNGVQWHLQPTCAITGDGLEEGMEMLQEMIARRRKCSSRPHLSKNGFKTASNTKLSSRKLHRSHSHVC